MLVAKFRPVYERHVGYVVVGDVTSALADMVQENIPAVFHGVDTPHRAVAAYEIRDVRAEGDRMIGETVYDTGDHVI
ncbi:hypothetical protein, partial [Mycobacterium sp.]|uniref:hypothetical protein n=1 Tax=Mycobacterium sp. TaxID=1785 RepID=UPI003BAFDFF9